jgi:hypothetical protein
MLTYADVCRRMLTYADVCRRMPDERRAPPHRQGCGPSNARTCARRRGDGSASNNAPSRLAPAPLDILACRGRGNTLLATGASSAHTRRGTQHMCAQQLPRRGAYVSAYVSIRCIRQHTSAYTRSAAATTRCGGRACAACVAAWRTFLALLTVYPSSYPLARMYQLTSAYVAYVSIREHTSF